MELAIQPRDAGATQILKKVPSHGTFKVWVDELGLEEVKAAVERLDRVRSSLHDHYTPAPQATSPSSSIRSVKTTATSAGSALLYCVAFASSTMHIQSRSSWTLRLFVSIVTIQRHSEAPRKCGEVIITGGMLGSRSFPWPVETVWIRGFSR